MAGGEVGGEVVGVDTGSDERNGLLDAAVKCVVDASRGAECIGHRKDVAVLVVGIGDFFRADGLAQEIAVDVPLEYGCVAVGIPSGDIVSERVVGVGYDFCCVVYIRAGGSGSATGSDSLYQ